MTINNNIQESYCGFEVAKLLKEKGFGIPTEYFYSKDGHASYLEPSGDYVHLHSNVAPLQSYFDGRYNWNLLAHSDEDTQIMLKTSFNEADEMCSCLCSRPTHALAVEWLRVNFGIWIHCYFVPAYHLSEGHWCVNIDSCNISKSLNYYKDPNEAFDTAIFYTLQNLIE